MMAHPYLVKKWAKFLKPASTIREAQQAQLMREAKQRKREFIARQGNLFDLYEGEKNT